MVSKKLFYALALIFLVIGIVAPTAIFVYNASLNQDKSIIVNNPNGQVTDGNVTLAQGFGGIQGISNAVPLVIGIVFFSLFGIMMYLGLKRED
jgi:hypothetical protein